ncbi:cyclin-dependent kinase inhibitor 5-like [Iris pallida]|uniref:Cyclin-dependent kinase inhibitor n=1 Tax=Iris pallida TaxID=29817 RepID=A0AAX6GST9_IRIPA|nr:cyclin-dependent kinase inhibitor 5-like [Iris pallida]KAJ6838967.1 cyclin-dependent kinase inhibitor 5-like [Iris pallida]
MGKYMKKTKNSDSSLMEASSSSPLVGVRTRAKTLALSRLHQTSSSYLQLRSRRLEKIVPLYKPKEAPKPKNPSRDEQEEEEIEVSFGENVLESEEGRCNISSSNRDARETTPCSLIRNPETIGTPGSSTRPNNTTTTRRGQSSIQRNIPTSREMEEFFSGPERIQQKAFIENYNFDPVKDRPLPGRYEWVKLES